MPYVYGKNTVREYILNNKNIIKVFCNDKTSELVNLAKRNNISVQIVDNNYLNNLVNARHQGIVAQIKDYKYYNLEDITNNMDKKYPFIVMLDSLEDPHNLGAILRTCDAAGVDGVIIGKNRSVRLNDTVAKVSTGAIDYVKVVEVTNLTNTIKDLKKKGFWIVGAEAIDESKYYDQMKYDMPTCLVVGSEGKGISDLVRKNCDFLVKIPMLGHVNSLNASVSCSILIYEIIKYHEK